MDLLVKTASLRRYLRYSRTIIYVWKHLLEVKFYSQDYFVSLLHKKLVGTRVLSIPVGARHGGVLPEGLRLYFHCSAQADNGDEGEAKGKRDRQDIIW